MYCIVDHWNLFLAKIDIEQLDMYFKEEYVKLYENEHEKAKCFIYEDSEGIFIFPYLLREFNIGNDETYYDLETAYGYGGPICSTTNHAFWCRAWESFYVLAQKNNYIAGFVRFHPILENTTGFECVGRLIQDRKTVAISLDKSEHDVWMNEIHTKNRNVIKKSIKNGLTFESQYDFKDLQSFIEIYNSTMQKLDADIFYYFNEEYYNTLLKNIKNSFLGIVRYNSEIIAAAIFFYEGLYGHYHLSGSKQQYLGLFPNNLMIWEAAKELMKHDVKLLHLGGGTDSSETNSLFLFKKKFSKSLYQFSIGKIIFNSDIYKSLCENWEFMNPEKKDKYKSFLLKYKY